MCYIKNIMEAKKSEYSDVEKFEILKTLSHFSSYDYDRIMNHDEFWKNKFKLDLALAKIKNGNAKFYTLDELDAMLEETISKYEN